MCSRGVCGFQGTPRTPRHNTCRIPSCLRTAPQRRRQRMHTVAESATAEAQHAAAPAGAGGSAHVEDKFIAKALTLARQAPAQQSAALDALHQSSSQALRTVRMPTRQTEEFRFTDLGLITSSQLQAAGETASAEQLQAVVQERALSEGDSSIQVVVRDGIVDLHASSIGGLPDGAYVGPISEAPADVLPADLGQHSQRLGGPLALMNGATAPDILLIVVPAGAHLESPVHVVYLATGGQNGHMNTSAPRACIALGADATVEVVEDFGPALGGGATFTNAVLEVTLEEGAALRHGYLQLEAAVGAAHTKSTFVQQAERSSYTLTEACLGAQLARHDVDVQQTGEETRTNMRHFVLSGRGQTHDVHTKLRLQHPRGEAAQLHKCIVSAPSGRGVFDGNVKVERLAQQTDAQQLSRNLLLVKNATVNVKPNLQIIADDVKCTHGCTVSDLEENQLFYFRSRGIDNDTARQMLVFSFGAEVTQHLKHEQLLERLQAAVNAGLASADTLAAP